MIHSLMPVVETNIVAKPGEECNYGQTQVLSLCISERGRSVFARAHQSADDLRVDCLVSACQAKYPRRQCHFGIPQ
jgi:hypothetical protein